MTLQKAILLSIFTCLFLLTSTIFSMSSDDAVFNEYERICQSPLSEVSIPLDEGTLGQCDVLGTFESFTGTVDSIRRKNGAMTVNVSGMTSGRITRPRLRTGSLSGVGADSICSALWLQVSHSVRAIERNRACNIAALRPGDDDPLIFDLNGDGFVTTKLFDPTVYFDLNADGVAESTGWVQHQDALLVYDYNQDDFVANGTELFGNKTFSDMGFVFDSGMQALQVFDSNDDGSISPVDNLWDFLKLWNDINLNGVSEVGEVNSLDFFGIKAINLDAVTNQMIIENGNVRVKTSSFINANNQQGKFFEYLLDSDLFTTDWHNIPVPIDIQALPNIYRSSAVLDLHASMVEDPILQADITQLVDEFYAEINYFQKEAIFHRILSRWLGYEIPSPYDAIMATQGAVKMLEEQFSEQYTVRNSSNSIVEAELPPSYDAGRIVQLYRELYNAYFAQFLFQTELQPIFALIEYKLSDGDQGEVTYDYSKVRQYFETLLQENYQKAQVLITYFNRSMWIEDKNSKRGWREAIFENSEILKPFFNKFRVSLIQLEENVEQYTDINRNRFTDGLSKLVIGNAKNNKLTAYYGNNVLLSEAGNDELIVGSKGVNRLEGGEGDDVLRVKLNSGSCSPIGSNDFIGGVGDDVLEGSITHDRYHFNRGDGNDVISDTSQARCYDGEDWKSRFFSSEDKLIFGEGVESADLVFRKVGYDLLIDIQEGGEFTADSVRVKQWFEHAIYQLELIEFEDGSQLTVQDVNELVAVHGTAEDDVINQSDASGDYRIYTYSGNDRVITKKANETIYAGAGDDYIDAGDGNNQLYGEAGNDELIVGSKGVNRLEGGEGDDVLRVKLNSGSCSPIGSNDFIGGVGDDVLEGSITHDRYHFNRGDGNDVISDTSQARCYDGEDWKSRFFSSEDKLIFGEGVESADLVFRKVGYDLLIDIQEGGEFTADSVRVKQWFEHAIYQLELIEFEDGSQLTVQDVNELVAVHGTAEDDVINQSDASGDYRIYTYSGNDRVITKKANETIYAGAGDDYIDAGDGNNQLYGEAGNDELIVGSKGVNRLEGGEGDDVLRVKLNSGSCSPIGSNDFIGGVGDDVLEGSITHDRYHFNRGDGNDVISDTSQARCYDGEDWKSRFFSSEDKLIFGEGVESADLVFRKVGYDLLIDIQEGGEFTADSVRVKQWFKHAIYQLELIEFEGGSPLTIQDVNELVAVHGTAEDDVINQSDASGDYRIYTYSGNDRVITKKANETIYAGAGDDYIDAGDGNNQLYGEAGNDELIVGYRGSNLLDGGEGDDVLRVNSSASNCFPTGSNDFIGGSGDDVLEGSIKLDRYYFNRGDGNDVISDTSLGRCDNDGDLESRHFFNEDKLMLGEGISPADLVFSKVGYDLLIDIQEGGEFTADSVRVKQWFKHVIYQLELIEFEDETQSRFNEIDLIMALSN